MCLNLHVFLLDPDKKIVDDSVTRQEHSRLPDGKAWYGVLPKNGNKEIYQ